MSWRMNSNSGLSRRWAMFCRREVKKLSTQSTSSPRDSSRSHRCDPMNPAPPVTRTRFILPPLGESSFASRLLVPRDRPAQAFLERRAGDEAELHLCPGGVEAAAGLAVGLREVADHPPPVAGHLAHHGDQIVDRHLASRTDVHRFRPVVPLRGQYDRLGGVVHVEELARYGGALEVAAPPYNHLRRAGVAGVDELLDERRDDVRLFRLEEMVPGAVQVHGE